MLYRFTVTANIDEQNDAKILKLKEVLKAEAEWIGNNVNVKVEDEECIQANKKRLVAPIITTLDTNTFSEEKNQYLSAAKLIMENLRQLDEVAPGSDFQVALTLAANCLLEKSASE